MKKLKWFRSMSLAEEKYVTEADPTVAPAKKRGKKKIIFSTIAACASIAIVFGAVWLALPYNVSKYSSNEYYPIIQKINAFNVKTSRQSERRMLLNKITHLFSITGGDKGNSIADGDVVTSSGIYGGSPLLSYESSTMNGNKSDYYEITDNQTEGVIEADLIKRSSKYIFYVGNRSYYDTVYGDSLRMYSIAGEESEIVGDYIFKQRDNCYYGKRNMYLSSDGKTCTVVTGYYCREGSTVEIISLDVSDPTNISENARFEITGGYQTSRMTDGYILLFTGFAIGNCDFSDETTFIPQITDKNGTHIIPADQIVMPDELTDKRYTVVTKLNADTLELEGCAAYLSYSSDAYVSKDNIYLSCDFTEKGFNSERKTTISCLSYGSDRFEQLGTVTVDGYIKDQWSMDEYDGILRVVTTTNRHNSTNASLYCVDTKNFKVVASVVDFAPPGEDVKSVRFDKTAAYVCTSIQSKDPVFFFDLSDLDNITCKDTGTIDGFSSSLINFGDYLIGIGQGASSDTLKIEVYEETADGVRSVDKYEREICYWSRDYKSYYIDRENLLIGLGTTEYFSFNQGDDERGRYTVLGFDGYKLIKLVNIPLSGEDEVKRGVYIDGYMYMFGSDDFKVVKIDL